VKSSYPTFKEQLTINRALQLFYISIQVIVRDYRKLSLLYCTYFIYDFAIFTFNRKYRFKTTSTSYWLP